VDTTTTTATIVTQHHLLIAALPRNAPPHEFFGRLAHFNMTYQAETPLPQRLKTLACPENADYDNAHSSIAPPVGGCSLLWRKELAADVHALLAAEVRCRKLRSGSNLSDTEFRKYAVAGDSSSELR
jgi:hypothetical protein